MGISQFEFERIVFEVAEEDSRFGVEINRTEVYLTYSSHKHTYKRLLDYNDEGEITGKCTINGNIELFEVKPQIFINRVYDKIQQLLNE